MISTCEEYNRDMWYVFEFFKLNKHTYHDWVQYEAKHWCVTDEWISLEEFLAELSY